VTTCPNAALHPWPGREPAEVLAGMPHPPAGPDAGGRSARERQREGLAIKPTLLAVLPPLRVLLVLDNLAGHETPEFVCWLFAHGIMPLDTPAGGSWLNRAESLQRIPKRRAPDGQHPDDTGRIIARFEASARRWNQAPTPFEWGASGRHAAVGNASVVTVSAALGPAHAYQSCGRRQPAMVTAKPPDPPG